MDGTKLRRLEIQHRLRVKTGCETCRIRKIKCDETKPACSRCTTSGRTCDGYTHLKKAKNSSHVAAVYRNSAFLALPQQASQTAYSILRSPPQGLSSDPMLNRSFEYFQTRTLPMWTEFFDSELWSRTVLQLSYSEPAIKHGILALSTMHERYESISPMFTANSNDFAFVQYMQAVKYSNKLLTAHQEGKVSLEVVLVACIIFVCYENLAGNYKSANMHLRNGIGILEEHKENTNMRPNLFRNTVANVLYRFDLQAMTFSDDTSIYNYIPDKPPECPRIQGIYTSNDVARDELVGLTRCVMWLSGLGITCPLAAEIPEWIRTHQQTIASCERWEKAFAKYQQKIPPHVQADPKIYAGNTLLKMCATALRIILGSGAGLRSEMAWDAFIESFKTIVDLAETIPNLGSQPQPTRTTTSPTTSSTPSNPQARGPKNRPIAPNPATTTPPPLSGNTYIFSQNPNPTTKQSSTPDDHITAHTLAPHTTSFTPSFELSPIITLFIVGCRCRDPITRRRAITLLLRTRRREGKWDSLEAGLVSLQWMRKEENLPHHSSFADLQKNIFLQRNPDIQSAGDVSEAARITDVYVEVKTVEGKIDVVYEMTTGEKVGERRVMWEMMGDEMRSGSVPILANYVNRGS
ncbi:hypothetical protein GQ44DRAFT_754950 [Phaeosphaeriaceae sp. PMI808]|nr:hypothetical protein GQ44DRAFT_754950 [Phaeosphaeriaceae sp. PMI808]